MKLYKELSPPYLMRINIKKVGHKTEHIVLWDCTQDECYDFLRNLIAAQGLSPFVEGKATNVEIREAWGGENGKAVSFSFRGFDPKEIMAIILLKLGEQQ